MSLAWKEPPVACFACDGWPQGGVQAGAWQSSTRFHPMSPSSLDMRKVIANCPSAAQAIIIFIISHHPIALIQ